VTIRLLAPPIHEFLPNEQQLIDEINQLAHVRETVQGLDTLASTLKALKPDSVAGIPSPLTDIHLLDAALANKQNLLKKVRQTHEVNPMLGHRGVRLGMTYPEIYSMQIRAVLEAAAECIKEGVEVHPEIMVPQVCTARELERVKEHVDEVLRQVQQDYLIKAVEQHQHIRGMDVPFKFGTMIEVVRACLRADQLAKVTEFFSFGTNDLTQATFSFSREDAEQKFLPFYNEHVILLDNPFETIDVNGVGKLMQMAVQWGRESRPDLKIGICGEQAGHPASVRFCHHIGLTYVSCSPPRVPVARLAASHAKLLEAEYRPW